MLTSSGQAANFYAVMNLCQAGDHVVSSAAIYGGTTNLFTVTIPKMGVECTLVSPDASEEELAAAFRPNTKVLFAETIANPALTVLDIEKFAKVAHEHGVPLIVDNTFATPINLSLIHIWMCIRDSLQIIVHDREPGEITAAASEETESSRGETTAAESSSAASNYTTAAGKAVK